MDYTTYSIFQGRRENADRIFELIEGKIVEKSYYFVPSSIAARIVRFTLNHVDNHQSGYVTGANGGYKLADDKVFVPDAAYISREHLPEKPSREVIGPPDLAVEVKSPTDSKRELRKKAEKYLAYGTQLVWLVFPDEQMVEVYVPDDDVLTVGIDGLLDGGEVLPGFKLAVKDIFK